MKLIAHYSQLAEMQSIDEADFKTHLPFIRKVPGLPSITVTRSDHTYAGEGSYLMAEMAYADLVALNAASGKSLDSFARGSLSLLAGRAEPWSR